MVFPISGAALCFIVCHAASADHFAVFVQRLSEKTGSIELYTSGPAIKKFQDRKIEVKNFSLSGISPEEDDALAELIAKASSASRVIFTDVRHPFSIKVQKALTLWAKRSLRVAYCKQLSPKEELAKFHSEPNLRFFRWIRFFTKCLWPRGYVTLRKILEFGLILGLWNAIFWLSAR